MPPTVFISYSHKDEVWKDRLVTHLAGLERDGRLRVWDDRRIRAGATSAQNPVVLPMRADPEPEHTVGNIDSQGSIGDSDPDGSVLTNLLEAKRWMLRVFLQKSETLVGQILDGWRERPIVLPELRHGGMLQSSVCFPA